MRAQVLSALVTRHLRTLALAGISQPSTASVLLRALQAPIAQDPPPLLQTNPLRYPIQNLQQPFSSDPLCYPARFQNIPPNLRQSLTRRSSLEYSSNLPYSIPNFSPMLDSRPPTSSTQQHPNVLSSEALSLIRQLSTSIE